VTAWECTLGARCKRWQDSYGSSDFLVEQEGKPECVSVEKECPGPVSSWRPPGIVEEINLLRPLGFSIVLYNTIVNLDLGYFQVKID
jgi:hypothetical protein